MKPYQQFSLTTIIIISLLLFTGSFAAATDITNGDTKINSSISGDVTGNSNSTAGTGLFDTSIVPTDDRAVYNNNVTIENGGKVFSGGVYGGITNGDGKVYDNTVTINNGGEADTVYGGWTNGTGAVSGNSVSIESGGQAADIYGGWSNAASDVTNNNVQISGMAGVVSGGWADGNGNVIGNIVEIHSGASLVYGGYANGDGYVTGNNVTINGLINRQVYGGWALGDGDVTNNTVFITNSSTVNLDIFGGWADGNGNVNGNSIEISGNSLSTVYGGYANGTGDVNGNSVSIASGGSSTILYGGRANGSGDVNGNSVSVESGGSATIIYAGWAEGSGTASGNSASIASGASANVIYGGWTKGNGDATYNTVSIENGGMVAGEVYGGVADGNGNVIGNSVEISGRVTWYVFGGRAYGDGDVIGNTVSIANGGSSTFVYGGRTSRIGDVIGNSVSIASGGSADYVYGGNALGASHAANVTANSVTIESGGLTGEVYAGYANGTGDVTYNTVTINGLVRTHVYGGYTTGSGTVENNTVNITSTANLASASLYGRNNNTASGTGNTLNVYGFSGDVVSIANFDNYNFVLGQLDSNLTVINITSGTPVDIDDTNITISFTREFINNNLSVGDNIIVIDKITNSNPSSTSLIIEQSPFIAYNFTETLNTQLSLTLDSIELQPQTKALAEGFAAGLAFLGQAADVRSSLSFASQDTGFVPFATMVYGRQYISSGSNITVKGFSALAGLALNTKFDNGSQLVVGAFMEGGWGDYNNRNSFSNFSAVKGNGDTEYFGGGVLARYAMEIGLYGEGSFAAGKAETDFRTWDFAPGTRSKYDYSVPYYSAHIAVGQILNLTDMLDLDVYGKYLWTRQEGDNVTVNDYRFKFKDADSHRLRAGGKLQANILPELQPYAGGAYEYEFGGKIKGSLYGMNLDKPSLRGGTAIGELGLVWSPTDAHNLKVDLGVQGYLGKREGITGGLMVSLSF